MNLKLDSTLKVAVLLSLVFNSALALSGFYSRSYDSYGHMFFADHYQKYWFNTWEPRWYMGFDIASYPPLAHQVLALLGYVMGLELAYVIITIVLMILLPIAIFRFSKVFVSEEAAGYSSLVGVFLPGILISVYGWGQYTTIFSLVITLFVVPSFHKFLNTGGILYFAEAIFLFEVAVASHHFTGLIFAPILLIATFLVILARKEANLKTGLWRFFLFMEVGLVLSTIIVYPVLFGAVGQGVNVPHPTTINYFQSFEVFKTFFFNMYGFFLVLIPLAVLMIRYRRDLLPLAVLAIFLLILGFGGSTPLPQAVFESNWLGLTYERFNLFAILTFAPLFGFVFVFLKGKKNGKIFLTVFMALSVFFAGWAVNDLLLRPHQQQVPVESIVSFLSQDNHWMWRYLTLGFESADFSKLSMYSNATTLDGWYYRGRNISELANSGVDFLGNAKYLENGPIILRSVLENASHYNLRWVFCNDRYYEPMLNETGFTLLSIRYEQVTVWAKYDSAPLETSEIANTDHTPSVLDYAWGIIPITWLIGLLLIYVYELLEKRDVYFLSFLA